MKQFLSIILLATSEMIFAQYTDVINSSKPGVTESAYCVGINVVQIENNTALGTVKANTTHQNATQINNQTMLRYGAFSEKLELQVIADYFSTNNTNTHNSNLKMSANGLRKLGVGAKYHLYEPHFKEDIMKSRSWKAQHSFNYKRLVPSVATFAHFNAPINQINFDNGQNTINIGVTAQNILNDRWAMVNQLNYDYLLSKNGELNYGLSNSYAHNAYLRTFGELNVKLIDITRYFDISIGQNYLINDNFQVHYYYTFSTGKDLIGHKANLGFSYRLDYHKDHWEMKKDKDRKQQDQSYPTENRENRESYDPYDPERVEQKKKSGNNTKKRSGYIENY